MPSFVNIWALLLSMIASVVLGFIWYGPLFGKKWMALSGIVMPDQKPPMSTMIKPIIISFIGAVLMSFALSSFIAFHDVFYQTSGFVPGLSIALLTWVCFIVPVHLSYSGWEGKPWTLFFINSGYWLVFLVISASFIVSFS